MVPADLNTFLVASLGAAASFIGLLFVAFSVVMQRTETDKKVADSDRRLAESSFTGFVNIFFVALVGLVPGNGLGWVCFIMAAIGLLNSWRLRRLSRIDTLIISGLVYLVQAIFGLYYMIHSNSPVNVGVFEAIIIFLFSQSLLRAWGLTGIRRK